MQVHIHVCKYMYNRFNLHSGYSTSIRFGMQEFHLGNSWVISLSFFFRVNPGCYSLDHPYVWQTSHLQCILLWLVRSIIILFLDINQTWYSRRYKIVFVRHTQILTERVIFLWFVCFADVIQTVLVIWRNA